MQENGWPKERKLPMWEIDPAMLVDPFGSNELGRGVL